MEAVHFQFSCPGTQDSFLGFLSDFHGSLPGFLAPKFMSVPSRMLAPDVLENVQKCGTVSEVS